MGCEEGKKINQDQEGRGGEQEIGWSKRGEKRNKGPQRRSRRETWSLFSREKLLSFTMNGNPSLLSRWQNFQILKVFPSSFFMSR